MARKHRLGPDTRDLEKFNWRRKDMPVVRDYVVRDDFDNVVERGTEEVTDIELVSRVSRQELAAQEYDHHYPNWRSDPTYSHITGQKKAPPPRPVAMKKSLIRW